MTMVHEAGGVRLGQAEGKGVECERDAEDFDAGICKMPGVFFPL